MDRIAINSGGCYIQVMPGPEKRYPIKYQLAWDAATKRAAGRLAEQLKVSMAEAIRLAIRHGTATAIRAGIRKDDC